MENPRPFGGYFHLIHITQSVTGEAVDRVGIFGGFDSGVMEGVAYEAVVVDGKPTIKSIGGKYISRFYVKSMRFTLVKNLFLWRRKTDTKDCFSEGGEEVCIPCINHDDATFDILCSDPQFMSLTRTLVFLKPVLKAGLPKIEIHTQSEQ